MAIVTIVTVVVMAARPPGRQHRTFGSWPVVMRIAQSGVAGAHETALQPIECALGMDVSAHEWSCAGEKNGDAHWMTVKMTAAACDAQRRLLVMSHVRICQSLVML